MTVPLVSCLTVTDGRLRLLKEAVGCYLRQSYPRRELVVVTASGGTYLAAVRSYVAALGRPDVRVVPVDTPTAPLGTLRNAALDAARGEYVCQWDDDDLYHPDRLALQFAAMRDAGGEASFLTDHLQFFSQDRSLFWLDWSVFGHPPAAPDSRELQFLPGSLLTVRHPALRYPETGKQSRFGEDNDMRGQVVRAVRAVAVSGHAHLYVYRCHGRNYMPTDHHRAITRLCATDRAFLAPRESGLRRHLRDHRLPGPYRVKEASGATVFTVRSVGPEARA